MLRVGLTGGIATGKSTVGSILRELRCHVIEADKIASRFMEPGAAAYEPVVREFGPGILTPDGRIDRGKLGVIVFADPVRLGRLNAIVHPLVLQDHEREFAEIERVEPRAIAVVEAALLIEAGYYKKQDCLVVTWSTPEQQLARLIQRDSGKGLTAEQATQRIASQMPVDEKRRLADVEIDCSGTMAHTREQVVAAADKLRIMESYATRKVRKVN